MLALGGGEHRSRVDNMVESGRCEVIGEVQSPGAQRLGIGPVDVGRHESRLHVSRPRPHGLVVGTELLRGLPADLEQGASLGRAGVDRVKDGLPDVKNGGHDGIEQARTIGLGDRDAGRAEDKCEGEGKAEVHGTLGLQGIVEAGDHPPRRPHEPMDGACRLACCSVKKHEVWVGGLPASEATMDTDAPDDISRYAGLGWWGPYSDAAVEAVVGDAVLARGDLAVDVACGRGALALWLARRHGLRVEAVDQSAAALSMLAQDTVAVDIHDGIVPIRADAATWQPTQPAAFVGWLGSPLLGGSFPKTVEALTRWLKPGGYLLLGHGFWSGAPPRPWLEASGIPEDTFTDWPGLLGQAQSSGLTLVRATPCTTADWDHFEGTLRTNLLASPPDTPGRDARLRFVDAQLRWGRDCLGLGLVLLQR